MRSGLRPVRRSLRAVAGRPATGWAPRISGAAERDTLAVVAGLGVLNVVRHLAPASGAWVGGTATLLLLAHARRSGLTWAQLGLGRDDLRRGTSWALGAIAAVGAVYLVGVLVPATRPAFIDARYQLPLPEALTTAFLVIPVGTVLLEEVAFRSVLWGLLERRGGTASALVVTSALFGLWHVLPSLRFAAERAGAATSDPTTDPTTDPAIATTVAGTTARAASRPGPAPDPAGGRARLVAGTVAFTALGGLVMGDLRRRSGSALASAGMHWATNGLGVLFGLAAHRLSVRRAARQLGIAP